MEMQKQIIGSFGEAYANVQSESNSPTKSTSKAEFLNYIQTYRAMAALCVVAVHCTALLTDGGKSIEGILFQRSTHMFVVMAGFVFQHLAKKFEWKKYYISKLKFVILPYILLNIPIILYRIFLGATLLKNGWFSACKAIMYSLLTGNHLITFWFIPMISLFYLAAPLFVLLDKDKRVYYFLPFFIVLSLYITRTNETTVNAFLMFIHFFSVYLTGMFLSRYKEQMFELIDMYLHYLLLCIIGLLVYEYFYSYWAEQMQYIQKSALSLLLLYAFRKYDKYVPVQVNIIANMSFGIYLIHGLVVFGLGYSFKYLVNGGQLVYNLRNYLLVFLLIMTITVSCIKIVQLLAKEHSRKLIGC
jgi:hypothetical protein